jgi:hypothetical protein
MINAKQISVSPGQAEEWLKLNTANRRVRGWWVKSLATMIKRGEWITTHQGVAFAQSGKLLDGQHRLMAIAESGISVDVMVFTNVPDKAFMVLDAGIKRSVPDLTGLPSRCSEVARLATAIALPGSATGKMSSQFILEVANCGILELHEKLMNRCPTSIKYFSCAPVRLAAILLVMDGKNESYVYDVYANLVYQDFDALPGIAKSLIRQVTGGTVAAINSSDTLGRALKALSPDYGSQTLLKLSDAEKVAATVYARSIIISALEASNKLKNNDFDSNKQS